jgi:malonyl-CoA/methylmalonyl-CoA synthetase
MRIPDLFAIAAERAPGKTALDARADGGRAWTYVELHAEAAAVAGNLRGLGVGRGDRVAFYLGNRAELVIAYLAVLRLGAAMVPINLAYRRREIAHILGDAAPSLLFTEAAQRPVLDELAPQERASLRHVVFAEELDAWRDGRPAVASAPPAGVSLDGDDLALLMYTSGTTGRSKGAMLSHDNVLATVVALLAAWGWSADDRLLLALPLFHTHGLVVGLHCALAAGATVDVRRRFDAAEVVRDLAGGGATLFFGVPTMYVRLVEELRRAGNGAALRSLRLFCSGSAPLSPETFAAFAKLTGHRILERYGMTETGMLLSNPYSAAAGERLPGTVGKPLPGVSARVVDGGGATVVDGAEGELVVRGSNVFRGYWQAPEKTAESFSIDGEGQRWFHTGDLARRDPASGHVTLLGRRTELILCGGYNVYPREIEDVLEAFPGVREAAVVGRPHPEFGESPVAFLVVDAVRRPEVDEILAHCKRQLAAFKTPRAVRFVESLPRNALGKVQKHLLPRD